MLRLYESIFRRWLFVFILTTVAVLAAGVSHAQKNNDVSEPGVVRIKVSKTYAAQLERMTGGRNSVNTLSTGATALNALNTRFKASAMQRVFPHAGKFEARHRKHGLHLWYEVKFDKSQAVPSAVGAYSGLAEIEIAEPVRKASITGIENMRITPVDARPASAGDADGFFNDPRFNDQWHYHNTGQVGGIAGADIDLVNAWKIETGKKDVIVAVIDGGIELTHPDLKDNLWTNQNEIPENDVDDDNNGFVDDIHGYSFVDDSHHIDPFFHGTHIAGTIAATNNNGTGVSGVAGGSGKGDGIQLMTCAIFQGEFPGLSAAGGMDKAFVYAADNGAVIAQNSWGYNANFYEQVVLDAIDYFIVEAGTDANGNQTGPMKGGLVIFSAGNAHANMAFYPGYYPPTLAVAGTSNRDVLAPYSNYGKWVDISAPGGSGAPMDITDPLGVFSTWIDGGYVWASGTSMASPHVSGIAALVVSKFGGAGYTADMLRGRLQASTDEIDSANPEYRGMLGTGRINALKALLVDEDYLPAAISDLTATLSSGNTVTLDWKAPHDMGNGVGSYDIRYSTTPITIENVNEAFPVKNTIVAKFPEKPESFAVTGLMPGTKYYFTIRAIDLSGNYSMISNVPSVTTGAATFSITPLMITAELQTTETVEQSFKIVNAGSTAINFGITADSTAMAYTALSVLEGSVAAAGEFTVTASFNAAKLIPGTYSQELKIKLNSSEVILPVNVQVISNGTPVARITGQDIDYGKVMIGLTSGKTIKVYNAGAETLELSTMVTHPDFVIAETILVQPLDSADLVINYKPTVLGPAAGELMIHTNDPEHESFVFSLSGEGSNAPDVEVTPASFTETLRVNETVTRQFTIRNTGEYQLEYTVKRSEQEAPSISTVFKAVRTKILLLTPDHDLSSLQRIFDKFEGVETTMYQASSLNALTLEEMKKYQIIYVTNITPWEEWVDPVKVGNLLADYVDAGGKVLFNNNAFGSIPVLSLGGRFKDENYGPFITTSRFAYIPVSIGPDELIVPDHPLLKDVHEILYGEFFFSPRIEDPDLSPGATALAVWSNGSYFLAVKDNVIAMNIVAVEGHDGTILAQGDIFKLYENAIRWFTEPSYVKIGNTAGVLQAGEEVTVDVEFDAYMLTEKEYHSYIGITTNVPGKGYVNIPVTLYVNGPEFTTAPESLEATAQKGEKATRTFTIRNNGTETFPVDISVQRTRPEYNFKFFQPSSNGLPSIMGNESDKSYTTNFEEFEVGDLARQNGWFSEATSPGGVTISPIMAASGGKCIRITSFGSYRTGRFYSPTAPAGESGYSTIKMNMYFQGMGTTWAMASLSEYYNLHNIVFSPDGTITAQNLPGDGTHSYSNVKATIPMGYFEFAVETERATGVYRIFIDGEHVHTGIGFRPMGNASVYVAGQNEVAGPSLFIDDLSIIDGPYTGLPEFITVTPAAATLAPGEEIEVSVEMNSEDLAYGKYLADVIVSAEQGLQQIFVPAAFTVEGAVASDILQDTVYAITTYNERDTAYFQINNTGGLPVQYSMEVLPGEEGSWFGYSPKSGNIPVRDVAGLLFYLDATGLENGKYTAKLMLHTDVPGEADKEVTLIMEVQPPPHIVVQPSSIHHTLTINFDYIEDTLTIRNESPGNLRYKITHTGGINTPEIYFPDIAEQMDMKGNTSVMLRYYADSRMDYIGTYYDTLIIESNDPDQPVIRIPLTTKLISWAKVEIDRIEIVHEAPMGTITTSPFNVTNRGETPLNFSFLDGFEATLSPWVTINPRYGTVKMDSTGTMFFTFDATELTPGMYYDTAFFSASDPNSNTLLIPVTFTVTEMVTANQPEFNSRELSAYPNPTDGEIRISLGKQTGPDNEIEIIVMNQQGQVVYKKRVMKSQLETYVLPLRHQPAGLYHVDLRSTNGQRSVLKVIKK